MRVPVFYNPKMSVSFPGHTSQSTIKPKLFTAGLSERFVVKDFEPVNFEDFKLAHTDDYVEQLATGGELGSSSGFDWNPEYAQSLRYTVGSMRSAIMHSISNGGLSISPTSGFHHATPQMGMDYCAVSGQVIASMLVYNKTRISGAYVDLDAHYGNSIDDTYKFQPDLIKAIPKGMNINPTPNKFVYIKSLEKKLKVMRDMLERGQIGYVVLCHGADSVEGDKKEGIIDFDTWIAAAQLTKKYAAGFPLVYSLFGGYRDNYQEVIDMHLKAVESLL